jgi:hypothetical protein
MAHGPEITSSFTGLPTPEQSENATLRSASLAQKVTLLSVDAPT